MHIFSNVSKALLKNENFSLIPSLPGTYRIISILVNIEPHSRKKVDPVEEKYRTSNQKNRPFSEKDIKFKVDKVESEVSVFTLTMTVI